MLQRKFSIWYMRADWFRDGSCGDRPDADNLKHTHVQLMPEVACNHPVIEDALEHLFVAFQGENWARGRTEEVRELLTGLGLRHTSMSKGDVIVDNDTGDTWVVASFGFDKLPRNKDADWRTDCSPEVFELAKGWGLATKVEGTFPFEQRFIQCTDASMDRMVDHCCP